MKPSDLVAWDFGTRHIHIQILALLFLGCKVWGKLGNLGFLTSIVFMQLG